MAEERVSRRSKSLVKTFTWRIIATGITASLAFAVTGKVEVAGAIATLDAALKVVAYYVHERFWEG